MIPMGRTIQNQNSKCGSLAHHKYSFLVVYREQYLFFKQRFTDDAFCIIPSCLCLVQEIFGPVLAVYVYPEKDYREVLQLIDNTSPYALTGAVFAQDQ